jgi:hypothetical protein
MKAGMIFARKTAWRSRLDLEYLDETSSRKVSARQQHDDGPKRTKPLRQFADYASKETLGQVHAGGFLHHLILVNPDGSRTAPSQLTNDERKRRISEAWFEHIRKYPTSSQNPVIQHRLVFSISRELHDKLVDAGINPDRVLQAATKKIMGKFNERFHPADSIGYAYGIHHDTDNLHVHVALCPRTARGAYVGCSTARNPASGHKDQMNFLRSCFERENKRLEQVLASPQKLEESLSMRPDSDKITFSPRLNPSQMDGLRNAQTAEAIRLQQPHQSIHNLEASIAAKRKFFALKRSANLSRGSLGDAHRRRRALPKNSPPPWIAVRSGTCRTSSSRSGRNTALPINATRKFTDSAPMPIESPSPIGSKTHSEFVLCERFAFRPSTVDGCSHQTYADGSAVTIVNFKSYTQTIPDSERRLFDFLIRKLKPRPAGENE